MQYDEAAKRLLAQKSLLALILKYTTEEFQEMTEEEIEECIEGAPEISTISVDPEEHMPRTEPACEPGDSGGKAAEQLEHPREIQGLSNESVIAGEGKVTYDIRFVVYRPGKIQKIKLMINIEAQKKWNPAGNSDRDPARTNADHRSVDSEWNDFGGSWCGNAEKESGGTEADLRRSRMYVKQRFLRQRNKA